jgi:hypothetical protein
MFAHAQIEQPVKPNSVKVAS